MGKLQKFHRISRITADFKKQVHLSVESTPPASMYLVTLVWPWYLDTWPRPICTCVPKWSF